MGVFNFFKKNRTVPKGLLAYYGLEKWFLSLADEEQAKIRECHSMGIGIDPNDLEFGNFGSSSSSSLSKQMFLNVLGVNTLGQKYYALTEKILLEALEAKDDNVIDRHFTYNSLIDLYYKQRESSPDAIEKCIKYCLEDINILEDFLQALKMEYDDDAPPLIPSIQRLIIIYEKLGNFEEGMKLCGIAQKLSLSDTTKGGFEGRQVKLEKKLNQQKSRTP